jgi:Ca-activated chloride channel family protein
MKKLLILLAPLFISFVAFTPILDFTVSGIITDDKGKAIPFATVMEKGTKNGTNTDAKGKFTLKVSSEKAIIVISSVGFDAREIKLNGLTNVSVALVASSSDLSEVVVTAVGIKKSRRETSYSVTKPLSNTQLFGSTAPSNGFIQSLNGKVSGVQITNSNKNHRDVFTNGRNRIADTTDSEFNTEDYDAIIENRFLKVDDNPLSTFSIDVDAASYSNIRRYIQAGQLPPAGAVRIEEMINYFKYDYEGPNNEHPFEVHTEMSVCPWNKDHRLVLVGLQGRKIPVETLPASNIVFLIDVSGSMETENKLPLVKSSMKLLVDQLREQDKVSMVVYAGNAGLVLKPTSGAEKIRIKDAIDKLEAGGSTAGGQGIKLAYKTAKENFFEGGNNRVILCTDGDFNVGVSSDDELERMIEQERKSGVFLTVLGYGMGNYKDNKMQKLADKGNGNHAYIDGISEAKKVLVNEFGGTLFTIAKDVKLQIEFNPQKVQGYRLIGYENRMLAKEDFNDDKKDAGELGSGHTVTALYEVIPVGVKSSFLEKIDKLRYQKDKSSITVTAKNGEIMNIKLRYKKPDGDVSSLIEHPVMDNDIKLENTSDNFRFAAAVAEFGLLLRNSSFKSDASFTQVIGLAKKAKGEDKEGYRKEFIKLVSSAGLIASTNEDQEEETDSKPVSKN